MARKRDYRSEYRRREQRARELGFAGEWARRKAPRRPRNVAEYALLPEAARSSRSASLSVVHRSRRGPMSVEESAAAAGVPMWEVRYWAADALQPTRRGRTLPRKGDRLLRLRPVMLEGESDVVFVAVRGSRAADRADAVFDVQWRVANDLADEFELEHIRGVRVAGRTVESDADRLRQLALAQAFNTDEVYREIVG
jgi:hypothetical protein